MTWDLLVAAWWRRLYFIQLTRQFGIVTLRMSLCKAIRCVRQQLECRLLHLQWKSGGVLFRGTRCAGLLYACDPPMACVYIGVHSVVVWFSLFCRTAEFAAWARWYGV